MEDPAATFVTIISSASGLFLLQQLWGLLRKARAGHLSWVRREVNKATKAQHEAESRTERAIRELGMEQTRRQAAEEALDAMRLERDKAYDERDAEAREKRRAYELMHEHRLIIMEVAPDRLPSIQPGD